LNEEQEHVKKAEVIETDGQERGILQRMFLRQSGMGAVVVPALAVFTALVIGGLIIVVSSPEVLDAWRNFGENPGGTLSLKREFRHFDAVHFRRPRCRVRIPWWPF
jgi:hypothetical protein